MMMSSKSFEDSEHRSRRHRTKRELFLEKMDKLVPWALLVDLVKPHCPKGRPPYPLETILRVHCPQLFFHLGDRPAQNILYDMPVARRFAGLSCGRPMPDETTMFNFRRLLELHVLGEAIFNAISRHLESKGFRLSKGTMVDVTIVAAPNSTKNNERARDPEMHPTRKGRQAHFGMKLHIGVDEETGLTHSLETTPANKSDVEMAGALLHGGEEQVSGDAGYRRAIARRTRDFKLTGRSRCGGASGRCLTRTGLRRPRRGARRRCGPGSSIRSGG